jgi:hypothetical protein
LASPPALLLLLLKPRPDFTESQAPATELPMPAFCCTGGLGSGLATGFAGSSSLVESEAKSDEGGEIAHAESDAASSAKAKIRTINSSSRQR